MTFNEYQDRAKATAVYPHIGENLIYPTLGLTGEAGEVADKMKKVIRDHNGVLDELQRNLIMLEVGDVLWYVSQLSFELGFSLEEIAQANLEKLAARATKGLIHGNGDIR